ncbi:hypothetical protein YC2023_086280 [Brassica napus]
MDYYTNLKPFHGYILPRQQQNLLGQRLNAQEGKKGKYCTEPSLVHAIQRQRVSFPHVNVIMEYVLILGKMDVMCDAYMPAGNPIPTNKRHNTAKIFSSSKVASEEPWYYLLPQLYGIEQEYTLMQKGVNWKLIIVSIMSSSNIIQTTILISFLLTSLLFGYRVLPLDNVEDLTMPTISKLQLRVLSVTSWLAEEFRQRTHVSGDDTKVLMELKELRTLKQMFETRKKNCGRRQKEMKTILSKEKQLWTSRLFDTHASKQTPTIRSRKHDLERLFYHSYEGHRLLMCLAL